MVRRIIACLVFGFVISGCATTPPGQPDNTTTPLPESVELVARNFASVLAQIPSLPPTSTTLSEPLSADDAIGFGDSLRSALSRTGYIIRTGNVADADGMLSYSVAIEPATELDKAAYTGDGVFQDVAIHHVMVGDIGFRRRYVLLSDGWLMPLSPMQARGFDSSKLVSDDASYESRDEPKISDERIAADTIAALPESGDDIAQTAMLDTPANSNNIFLLESDDSPLVQPQGESEALALAEPSTPSATPIAQQSDRQRISAERGEPIPLQDTRNFRDLGRSNYSQVFSELRLMNEQVIEFANDSTELNLQAHEILDALLGEYNENRDTISVIGSSHGAGAYPGAQQELAQARASQVQDKLTSLGVSPQNVFVEASWSTQYYDEMLPRRGVVVSLWRSNQ